MYIDKQLQQMCFFFKIYKDDILNLDNLSLRNFSIKKIKKPNVSMSLDDYNLRIRNEKLFGAFDIPRQNVTE